jgi:hypothetical protein
MRFYQQQAEKSDHKRTWAGISYLCTVIKSLNGFADLVLGAGDPKTRFEAKYRDLRGGLVNVWVRIFVPGDMGVWGFV